MSRITFTLHRKALAVSMLGGAYSQKLSFEARLPKRQSLSTREGKDIKTGYVEFVSEKPRYETEMLHFVDAMQDIDTGRIDPPSICFYAKVTPEIFALIRDSDSSSLVELRIQTNLTGAIQFDDPLGEAKIWDISRQNPVPVETFELVLSQPESDT